MKVITAPDIYNPSDDEIILFLAGGITGCPDWQSEVIGRLKRTKNLDRLVVYNPRRENFPIGDPNAAEEQITWEYRYLSKCDIFSMYFCAGESDQPICMYELGRYGSGWGNIPVISVEDGYKRAKDVQIQIKLALNSDSWIHMNADPVKHTEEIIRTYNLFK